MDIWLSLGILENTYKEHTAQCLAKIYQKRWHSSQKWNALIFVEKATANGLNRIDKGLKTQENELGWQ